MYNSPLRAAARDLWEIPHFSVTTGWIPRKAMMLFLEYGSQFLKSGCRYCLFLLLLGNVFLFIDNYSNYVLVLSVLLLVN